MRNKSIKSKVMTGVILASMVISASTGVFAADSTSTTKAATTQHQGRANGFQTKLDALVSSGTLTSDQESAIKTALMPQGGFKIGAKGGMFKNKLSELVTAGTITTDEQTAIETALTEAKGNFKTALDSLVTAGTLTSDKVTAIETALKPQGIRHQGQPMEKATNTGEHKDMLKTKLDTLVTAGTITADQEAAVLGAFTPSK